MVTRKREFAFQGTGAVKHSRLPPRSPRQVIKALLNWFLFPVELFYLTKNRQNVETNNESGLLDRNSLRTVSIVAFSYFSLFSLSLSLSSSLPSLPSFLTRFFSSSLPVENVDDNDDGARWKRKLFPRFASQTRRFNDETRPKEERAVFPAALLSLAWDFNFTVAANLLPFFIFFLAGSNRLLFLLLVFSFFFKTYSHQVGYCRRRRRCRCRHAATGNNWRGCARGEGKEAISFDIFLIRYQSFDGTNLFPSPLEFFFLLIFKIPPRNLIKIRSYSLYIIVSIIFLLSIFHRGWFMNFFFLPSLFLQW